MSVNYLKITLYYSTYSELSNQYPLDLTDYVAEQPLDQITQTFIFNQSSQVDPIILLSMVANTLKIILYYSIHSELSNECPIDHIMQILIFIPIRSIISIISSRMVVNILKIILQYSTHSELSNEYPLNHATQTFIFTQLRSSIAINILTINLNIIPCSST